MGRKTKDEEEKLRKMDQIAQQRKQEEQEPATIAYGMKKDPVTRTWLFITYELKGGKVIKETSKECMDKDHAIEVYKLAFVDTFIIGK